jgi:hypothetical protein
MRIVVQDDPWGRSGAGLKSVHMMRVNGLAAPLFFVSPTPVDMQVPWKLAGRPLALATMVCDGVESGYQHARLRLGEGNQPVNLALQPRPVRTPVHCGNGRDGDEGTLRARQQDAASYSFYFSSSTARIGRWSEATGSSSTRTWMTFQRSAGRNRM